MIYNPPLNEVTMRVNVRLLSGMRRFTPPHYDGLDDFELELPDEATVSTIIERLKIPDDVPKTVLVNRLYAGFDTVLGNGDTVSVLEPVAGG
jgi:molybdopterin converting factor small subunit